MNSRARVRREEGVDMRTFQRLATAITAAALLTLSAAAAAPAATAGQATGHTARVPVRGGHTTVTTAPGIAAALIGHHIIPSAISPGTERVRHTASGVVVTFCFPVTGGRVSLNPLGGRIRHRGGILFSGLRNGTKIAVSNFTISLTRQVLTGIVNGNPHARVPLFRLGLAHAVLKVHGHWVAARGIVLRLTRTAANALDATFGTTLFKAGLVIGTAATKFRI
jgi:hypothetical protein